MRTDRLALAIAALAGASAWVSLGVLTVTGERVVRIGALPPVWLLPLLVITGLVVVAGVRLRSAQLWPLILPVVLWLPWVPLSIPAAWLIWEGLLDVVR